MKHLMRVLELKHYSRDGKLLWEKDIVPNIIHAEGELYCLTALFTTLVTSIPANYFAGLDNRAVPARSDTLANLSQEPSQFGYARQPLDSGSGFNVSVNSSGVYQATSNVITFVSNGGTWGPVKNIFLTTSSGNTGKLISTAALDGQHFLSTGEQLTMRLALTLRDFPAS
jgi:hypothetical protein